MESFGMPSMIIKSVACYDYTGDATRRDLTVCADNVVVFDEA